LTMTSQSSCPSRPPDETKPRAGHNVIGFNIYSRKCKSKTITLCRLEQFEGDRVTSTQRLGEPSNKKSNNQVINPTVHVPMISEGRNFGRAKPSSHTEYQSHQAAGDVKTVRKKSLLGSTKGSFWTPRAGIPPCQPPPGRCEPGTWLQCACDGGPRQSQCQLVPTIFANS
jgi:hypothetical protein